MIFNKCKDCSREFLFSRRVCLSCKSERFEQVEISKGTAIETVHLIATPSPFPDEYDIVLFEGENGALGFCRTTNNIETGEKISVLDDEYGPVCIRS